MLKRIVSGLMLILLSLSMLVLVFNIQPVAAHGMGPFEFTVVLPPGGYAWKRIKVWNSIEEWAHIVMFSEGEVSPFVTFEPEEFDLPPGPGPDSEEPSPYQFVNMHINVSESAEEGLYEGWFNSQSCSGGICIVLSGRLTIRVYYYDLFISPEDIVFSSNQPKEGEVIVINATVHNSGPRNATDILAQFYDGDPLSSGSQIGENQTISEILAGENRTVCVNWNTTGLAQGKHEICVITDQFDEIFEASESNNKAKKEITVTPITITVPDDYLTIQEAINNANEGDTVFVKTGTYHENVVVNKTVSLIGENRSTTIIDGNGTGTVVFVTESNVLVRGFTTRNGGGEWPDSVFLNESRSSIIIDNVLTTTEYGIRLRLSNNTVVSDNIISNNGWVGIFSWFSSNNTIRENMVTNNTWCGICLDSSSNSTVSDNTITDTEIGIYSHYSLNNSMSGNNVTSNRYGIFLDYSSNNVLRDNVMAGNKYNFGVCSNYWLGELSHFINDVDASNTVDGRPILYLVNEQNRIIDPPTASNIGYLAVINSTNIVVRHLNMKNNWEGIFLAYTKDSLIQNVTVTSNYYGINLVSSSNISITENNITNNGNGVYLARSSNNTILENSIANNEDGVWLYDHSCNNSISGNNVTTNKRYGIYLGGGSSSVGNSIFHNNFVENQQHALIKGYHGNLWDSDYLSGGNYWSDYTERYPDASEIDDSGIWDTPYVIDDYNQDNYPLMNPWTLTPPVLTATVDIHPQALNLRSKGEWITAFIELPEGYDVNDIDVSSIMLNDTVPAELKPVAVGDYDDDGIPDLMVKFDRAEVTSYILSNIDIEERFMTVTLTITGKLNDETPFQGNDTIRIICFDFGIPWRIVIAKILRLETYMQRFWR